MPECGNCGAFVTDRYVRVFSRAGENTVRCCPDCEDKIRRNGRVDDARSSRQQADGGRQ